MNISVVQFDMLWEEKQKNMDTAYLMIEKEAENPDLIVLPEMFTTGFTMHPERVAEKMNGETVEWLKKTAKDFNSAISGSIVIEENGKFYNRFLFVTPQGEVTKYDKRHLFRMAKEHEIYEMGDERVIINYMGWRIMPMVCYDLRFPVWSRNNNDYDLMIYVASWPDVRSFAWKTLSKARAIENLSYLVSCNRVGEDIKMKYSGDSAIYDFKGETLANIKPYNKGVINFSLSLEELEKYRNDFPAHLDADKFSLL